MADIQKLNVNNTTYDISTTWTKVTGKPSTFTPSSHTHSYLQLSGGTLTGMVTMKKSSASDDAIYWVETTNSNHRLGFGEGASGNRGMYDSALGWVFKIDTSNNVTISSSASTSSLTVNPLGNVLIGTTTDNGYKLQVNGSERVYGDLIVDGEVSALVA